MSRVIVFALFLLNPMFESQAFAWGCQGHQIVAYIAEHNLNPNATKNVADLLSDAQNQYVDVRGDEIKRWCEETELGPMEYFATWADDIRSPENASWHFWDIPLAKNSAMLPDYCDGNGCVISAVATQLNVLQSSGATRSDKQRALLFVIHLVGDMHQPMHIVDNGDRGGNCVPVNFQYKGYSKSTTQAENHGTPTGSYTPNLHSIWDTNMIAVYSGNTKGVNQDDATSAMADRLLAAYDAQIKTEVNNRVDFNVDKTLFTSWANKTHVLAKEKSYTKMSTNIPINPNPKTLTSCSDVSGQFVNLGEVANEDFVNNTRPVIELQLAIAGGRLAAVLNSLWP